MLSKTTMLEQPTALSAPRLANLVRAAAAEISRRLGAGGPRVDGAAG
jgi:hypothetical protein